MDQTYPTASIPATMPLLFLLSLWGTVTAFRPKALGQIRLARIILVAAAAAPSGVLLWGYISERYMADFMPFLIVAAVGMIDVFGGCEAEPTGPGARPGRPDGPGRLLHRGQRGHLALAGRSWTLGESERFVSAEKASEPHLARLNGQARSRLPDWAPGGQLFIANNCSGLYLSTGNSLKDDPGQLIQHLTWLPVEQEPDITHTIGYTFNEPPSHLAGPSPLTYGPPNWYRAFPGGVPVL